MRAPKASSRDVWRRDRRGVRRREADRWWARVGLGRLEELHAPGHQHHQLLRSAASGPRRRLHCL